MSYFNLASGSFSKLSRAPSGSNCSGVSAGDSQAPRHTGQRGDKCQWLLLLLAIQFHLHEIQNGSLPALGVAAPRVVEHWNITSSRHARIHVAIAREVDVWCNPVFPAQLPMSLHVGRCIPTRVSVAGNTKIKQESTCRVPTRVYEGKRNHT